MAEPSLSLSLLPCASHFLSRENFNDPHHAVIPDFGVTNLTHGDNVDPKTVSTTLSRDETAR